eukprot:CAMPEP_0114462568 /NCGR_PEP_ID=MMETSP0104-20121206/6898_1 /TAXON_ID=37642 ORGANISM="Paraphysomonas imperforata, Strain PA2" /NCGR_SAMPLE_ID=MMETSP0104 /ASSEMBLY_ACC=CAM_ASM_000202 /LENGTH=158 /DNA_ID=CAMNT_0001635455 /DNA_START=185 /DNA_END=658 /DNA_ORIENTATION=+
MATIFFGANDAVSSDDPQHCPLEEYQRNITLMVELFRRHNPDIRLILITPGTVDYRQWESRHHDQVSQYANAIREIGASLNIPVVDLWTGQHCFDISSDFSDGLHLSKSGNEKLYNAVLEVIETCYKGHLPEEKTHFPTWRELAGRSTDETRDIIEQW